MPDIDLTNNIPTSKSAAFVDDKEVYNKKTQAVPKPEVNIGVDTDNEFLDTVVDAGMNNLIDTSAIDSFNLVSKSRDQVYALLETMCEDSIIAAVLETYVEDVTIPNETGKRVWATSDDAITLKYVNYLLDSLNVDKYVADWVTCLCKYGDVYLRLYRESEYDNNDLFSDKKDNETLNEDIKVNAYKKSDHFVNYVEMAPDPAVVFELTKFGKSYAYIVTEMDATDYTSNMASPTRSNPYQPFNKFKFKKNDINIYAATEFVHACLTDDSSRKPEEVQIFMNTEDYDADKNAYTYKVRRGKSLFYDAYNAWRVLTLLENSVLLNRLTQSSIVRVIGVEVGDMGKEQVKTQLLKIKNLIENKTAINTGTSLNEYQNPGPYENNVYMPTRGGVGAITSTQIGGDVDVGDLVDLDYFRDRLFGALKIPKQYFGMTDDSTGFNGGSSLTIISSRYAKTIEHIQGVICQMVTDIINILLIDKGMDGSVNKFTIKMQTPTTQEEIDRRENMASKTQLTADIMNMMTDIEDPKARLKILKALLSDVINNEDALTIIQKEIEKLETEGADETAESAGDDVDYGSPHGGDFGGEGSGDLLSDIDSNTESEPTDFESETSSESSETSEESLPTPSELAPDIDFSENT